MRWLRRVLCATCSLLAGVLSVSCPMYGGESLYGPPTPSHDPDVALAEFSYTPPSPIRHGTLLTFSANLNKPTETGQVAVEVGDESSPVPGPVETVVVFLQDDGQPPDAYALDGVWSGQLLWGTGFAVSADSLPVIARLFWYDGYPGQLFSAPSLTVIPEEDEP